MGSTRRAGSQKRERRGARDLAIIDANAERLSAEALDALDYQAVYCELYRVRHPSSRDPKRARVFVVVSRQALMESRFSTVICALVYSRYDGLATQVPIGQERKA